MVRYDFRVWGNWAISGVDVFVWVVLGVRRGVRYYLFGPYVKGEELSVEGSEEIRGGKVGVGAVGRGNVGVEWQWKRK